MAARVTDKQKKKIIADYLELGSYRAVAKKNNVSDVTVKRITCDCSEMSQKVAQKKEQDDADIIAYMESKRSMVCEIITNGLTALADPDKMKDATPSQITTAIGTLIDKWTITGAADTTTLSRLDDILSGLKDKAHEEADVQSKAE